MPAATKQIDERTAAVVPQAAYIHVPFCEHQCGYCDFASVAGQQHRADEYLDALEKEMSSVLGEPRVVRTIFIGGGTPTFIEPDSLLRLMRIVHRWFDPGAIEEFTVEANPNTLDGEKVAVVVEHGVNRVSLGAQSFHPPLLEQLERNHQPESVASAIELLRPAIDNISIDLIFGIPTQTLDQWASDLSRMLALQPNHCSAYGLTYEKGTRLWRQRQLGVVTPAGEELEREMFDHVIDRLTSAGWNHYEVSNFSRPGLAGNRECLHNRIYWRNWAYFGFGTGAAAYVDGVRTLNIRDLESYICRCNDGRSPVTQSETLDPEPRARETAILQLRLLEGLNRRRFSEQTGFTIEQLAGPSLDEFVGMQLLEDDGRTVRFTRQGLAVADGVLQAMIL